MSKEKEDLFKKMLEERSNEAKLENERINKKYCEEFVNMIARGLGEVDSGTTDRIYFFLCETSLKDYNLTVEDVLVLSDDYGINLVKHISKDGKLVLFFFLPEEYEMEKQKAISDYEEQIREDIFNYHYWNREGKCKHCLMYPIAKQNKYSINTEIKLLLICFIAIIIFYFFTFMVK